MPAEAQRECDNGNAKKREEESTFSFWIYVTSLIKKQKEVVGGGGKEEMRNSAKLKLISPSKQFMPS